MLQQKKTSFHLIVSAMLASQAFPPMALAAYHGISISLKCAFSQLARQARTFNKSITPQPPDGNAAAPHPAAHGR
jgi:hypothetical protein